MSPAVSDACGAGFCSGPHDKKLNLGEVWSVWSLTAWYDVAVVQAHRELLETDEKGHLRVAPNLPPLAKVEAIFLVLGPDQPRTSRRPSPELAKLRITGDVVTPVLDEKDWGFGP
jgi:hypothetical protein